MTQGLYFKLALILALNSYSSFAQSYPKSLPIDRWFVGVGGGYMGPFATKANNLVSSEIPGFDGDFYASNGSKGAGQYSLIGGYQLRGAGGTPWVPAYSLSLQYTYTDSASVKGFIFVNNLLTAKNFTYKYDISQQIVMAKFKADLYEWWRLMPYFSGAAGLVVNQAHNYSDRPLPGVFSIPARNRFASRSKVDFAGTLGLGLDFCVLNDRGQISLGYELSYYGKTKTGRGRGLIGKNILENGMNANAVVLQGVYFLDW